MNRRPVAAALLLLAALLFPSLPSARAEPGADARRQAAALRAKVDALRLQAEIATEDYDAAYAELGRAVSKHLSAEQELTSALQTSGASASQADRRVRALYMAGGSAGLYARVLDSGSISDLFERAHQVGIVLDGDRRATQQASTAVRRQAAAGQRLAEAAAAATRLQAAVSNRADQVRALLAETDALLAQADEHVRVLAEQQRLAAEAAAATRAAQALALARNSATDVGVYTGLDLPPVSASPRATIALAFARAQLGKPYLWGATGPEAYDCSGLTGAAYLAAGLALPRTSREQWFAGPHVALGDLQPGDLVFWGNDPGNPASIHHVALYAGDGLMVAAPHSGDVVKVEPMYLGGYLGAVRPGASALTAG